MKPNMRRMAAALAALAFAGGAHAQAIVSTGGESFVESRLLVGAPAPDGSRDAGIELTVRPGWKTYWRSPGEAGVPPGFDWSRSRNLAGVEIGWPTPQVFESFGLDTVGYAGTVVLPLRLTPADAERPIEAALDLSLGVCRDICVLEEADLAATIPPDAPGPAATRIAVARASEPPPADAAGIAGVSCEVAGTGSERSFRATLTLDRPLADPYVALEAPDDLGWFRDTTATAEGRTLSVSSTLALASDAAWIDRSSIRMTVLDPALAADVQGCGAG